MGKYPSQEFLCLYLNPNFVVFKDNAFKQDEYRFMQRLRVAGYKNQHIN